MTEPLIPPVQGNVRFTSSFLEPRGNYDHLGTDFGAQTPGVAGDPIVASASGTIVFQYNSTTYGNAVVIEVNNGDGTYSYLLDAHLQGYASNFTLSPDQPTIPVNAGDVIGQMGNTGASANGVPVPVHDHFEQINTDGQLDFSHGWPLGKGDVGVTASGVAWERVGPSFQLPNGTVVTSDNGRISTTIAPDQMGASSSPTSVPYLSEFQQYQNATGDVVTGPVADRWGSFDDSSPSWLSSPALTYGLGSYGLGSTSDSTTAQMFANDFGAFAQPTSASLLDTAQSYLNGGAGNVNPLNDSGAGSMFDQDFGAFQSLGQGVFSSLGQSAGGGTAASQPVGSNIGGQNYAPDDGSVFSTGAPGFNTYGLPTGLQQQSSSSNPGSNGNPSSGTNYADNSGYTGGYVGGGDFGYGPVVLDLAGRGVNIAKLTSSNTFEDVTGDGYKNRTAWAGAGNAVLFVDPTNSNTITQANQIDFTDWDPTATTDMQALLDVFDTNHDGKLDAGDADFSDFKLMVTNADGTQSVETLAQAGITSIDLSANNVSQELSDGSSIDGETTYTKTDGSTGTAATVTFAADPNGYVVASTTTTDATTGAVTVDNKALNADGSLANETISTTSADGLTKTIDYDLNGDGQVDLIQTDDTVVSGGVATETLTDATIGGVLLDQTVTTTSTNATTGVTTVTIDRDANGSVAGGVDVLSQREVDTTSGGLTTVAITDLNPDGSERDQTVTTPSAGGLTSTVQQDINGDGTFDLTTATATTVNATTGARTTVVTDSNADGSERDQTVTVASASGLSKSVTADFNGDGAIDLTTTSTIVQGTTSSVVGGVTGALTTVIDTAGNGSFLDETVTFVSNDGLTIVTQRDVDGGGTSSAPAFNQTTTDVTTIDATTGARTETVTDRNADGSLRDQTVTVRGADGISRTTEADTTGATLDGASVFNVIETVVVASSGSVVDTASSFAANGALIDRTTTTSSADGLTSVVQHDVNGDGTVDFTTTTTTSAVPGGGTLVTVTDAGGNGTVIDTTTTTTSADGLTITTQSNVGGDALQSVDATTINATTGLQTETVSMTSANGTLESRVVTTTTADRETQTITSDFNGDGHVDQVETIVKQSNGSVVDTLSTFASDGTLVSQSVATTSATGLSKTTTTDQDGKIDLTTTDVTVLNADGSRTETVTQTGNNGTQIGQTVTTTSATGLSTTTTSNIDGAVDFTTTDVTVLNADGSRTETVTKHDSTGAAIESTATITSASGLSVTTRIDENGDGVVDVTSTDLKIINADGSTTETVTSVNADGTLRSSSVTNVSANGLTLTIAADTTGDGAVNQITSQTTQANGSVVKSIETLNQDGSVVGSTVTTTSADGLSTTTQVDLNGDGVFDQTTTDVTVLNSDGSTTETVTTIVGTSVVGSTVTTTSADGLSKTTTITKDGAVVETDQSVLVYNTDGSQTRTVTVGSGDGALQSQVVTSTSADLKTTTIQSNTFGSVPLSVTETKVVQADGSTVDTVTDFNSSGTEVARTVATTSANGLSTTISSDQNADGTVDETQSDVITIGVDGSRTETFTDSNGPLNAITGGFTESATVVTVTSGNGLSSTVTTTGTNGQGSLDHTWVQNTVINADGSETTTDTETIGTTARDVGVTTTSRSGLTVTRQVSTLGNGIFDRTDVLTTNLNGSTTETITDLNQNGSVGESETVNISADGRTKTVTDDTLEAGVANRQSTTVTPSLNGVSTEVTTNATASGVVLNSKTTATSANGLSTTIAMDTNRDGVVDETRTDIIVLNADGSRTETVTDVDGSGARIDQQISNSSADGLTVSTTTALTGAVVSTATRVTTNNSDGSKTDVTTTVSATGSELSKTTVQTSADGRTVATTYDLNGDGTTDITELSQTAANGVNTVTDSYFNSDGSVSSRTVTTTSANGRDVTVARNDASDPGSDTLETTLLSADGSGSYSFTQQDSSGAYLVVADHLIDSNGIDTVNLTVNGTETTVAIATAQEAEDLARVQSIYTVVLGRQMSAVESQTWLSDVTSAGLDTTQLANNLMTSAEFTEEFGSLTNTTFIDLVYQNSFGRAPNASELNAWVTELNSGAVTRANLVVDLSRIADAPQPGAQFNLLGVPGGNPQFIPFAGGGGGGGGGGAPDEIISFNSSNDTTIDSYYDPDTGTLQTQVVSNSTTGDQVSTQYFNDAGQSTGNVTYDASGNELQSTQIDPATGDATAAQIYGNNDVTSLNGADITDVSGNAAIINGDSNAVTLEAGTSATVDGNDNNVSLSDNSGSIVNVSGDGNAVTSSGNVIGFNGSGDDLTVNGSDNSFTFSGSNDILTVNQTSLGAGVISEADTYSVDAGAATQTDAAFNFTDGSSELQTFDPSAGISVQYQDFSGANESGTLVDQGVDFTSGGSQFQFFDPSSGVTLETDNYTGTDGTGTVTSTDLNFTDGTSEQQLFDPSTGVSAEFLDFSGANETGELVQQTTDFTAGNSQLTFFDPATGVSQEVDSYTGTNGTGTLTTASLDFTDGSSELQTFDPSTGVTVEYQDYSGTNETGTLIDQGVDFSSGGSQFQFFNPAAGTSLETDTFTGADGTGTLTSAALNFTDGTSELQTFDPNSSISVEFQDFSGANETGTLEDREFDFTAGGSQIEFFNPEAGVSDIIENFTGADTTGELTTAVQNNSNGSFDDITFNYSGGTETSYTVDGFGAGGNEIFFESFTPSGSYIPGSGGLTGYGYYGDGGGGGGYYGGGGYGGYDFARSIKTSGRSGSDISQIAAHDSLPQNQLAQAGLPASYQHADNPHHADGPYHHETGTGRGGSKGTDISVIASYDLTVAHDASAAKSAEHARWQAEQSANSTAAPDSATSQYEGARWTSNVVTWSIASSPGTASSPFSDYIGSPYQSVIEQAFETWAAASGLTFEEVPDSAQSDIRIGWGDFSTSSSGVVGFTASNAQNGQMQSGAIIRLEDPSETSLVTGSDGQPTYAGTQAELYQVVLHEIGHALGLADNADPNSIMYYESGSANRTLDQTDLNGIQALYNPPPGTPSPIFAMLGNGRPPSATDIGLNRLVQAMATFHADAGAADGGSHLDHFVPTAAPPVANSLPAH